VARSRRSLALRIYEIGSKLMSRLELGRSGDVPFV
jgi:hypothetical protein